MNIFEIGGKINPIPRFSLYQAIFIFGFIHSLYLNIWFTWFLDNWIEGECIALALVYLRMLDKRERNLYRVVFDEEKMTCQVEYYYCFFLTKKKILPYEQITFVYKVSRYLRGTYVRTLKINRGRWLVVELRKEYNSGWTNEEINAIISYLSERKMLVNVS